MAIQPLHAAVAGNHYEVARMLLDAGAYPISLQVIPPSLEDVFIANVR